MLGDVRLVETSLISSSVGIAASLTCASIRALLDSVEACVEDGGMYVLAGSSVCDGL